MNNEKTKTINTTPRSLEDYPDVLTVYDLSAILRINRTTAYELLHDGHIPYLRIGTVYRISKKALLEYLGTK